MNEIVRIQPSAPKRQELPDEQAILATDELSKITGVLYCSSFDNNRPNTGEIDRAIACALDAIKSGAFRQLTTWIDQARAPASRKEIIDAVSILIGSNPRPAQDLQVYGRMLCQDVIGAQPTRIGLHDALSRLRRTCEYLPTIATVLQALEASESRFRNMERMLKKLPELLPEAQERREIEIRRLAERVAAFERRRDEREAHVIAVANDPEWAAKNEHLQPDWTLKQDLEALQDGGVEAFRLHYDRTRNHPEGWR
jgi:hypothetical protein